MDKKKLNGQGKIVLLILQHVAQYPAPPTEDARVQFRLSSQQRAY